MARLRGSKAGSHESIANTLEYFLTLDDELLRVGVMAIIIECRKEKDKFKKKAKTINRPE